MPAVEVSVVVPCRDAAAHLEELLGSLASSPPSVGWEVLVVDDGSRDGTVALARAHADVLPVRIVDPGSLGRPGLARNAGVMAAGGGHVVFLDADDTVAPGYVDAMHDALGRADLVASRPEVEALNPGWVARSRPLGVEDGLNHSLGFLPYAASACLGVRRDVFEALGGFAPMPTCEDIDLCWRAQLAGHVLAPAPGAILHYRLRDSLTALGRQAVGYGRSMPLLYRRFAASGMPRPSPAEAARAWWVATGKVASGDRGRRGEGVYLLGLAAGRVVGSVQHRAAYL